MASVEEIKIRNLRSIVDTGWIKQKPITILVGKNSAGKSTFARVYPLLKQSVEAKKQSPILWFGQYVDFGQYSVAVHNKAPTASISLAFRLTASSAELDPLDLPHSTIRRRTLTEAIEIEAEIFLAAGSVERPSDTIAHKLFFTIFDFKIEILFDDSGVKHIKLDENLVWTKKAGLFSHVIFDSAIPQLKFYKERVVSAEEQASLGDAIALDEYDAFGSLLYNEIRFNVHGNVSDEKVHQIAARLGLADGAAFLKKCLRAGSDQNSWIQYVSKLEKRPHLFRRLQRAVVCARLPEILSVIDSAIGSNFLGVRYIEPLRATAQRYYRKQDLAIGEIDSKGANVAQFLQGLPEWHRQQFNLWCADLFGFSINPRTQGGHIELILEQSESGTTVNLADAGVGFSQILPILLQFWASDHRFAETKTLFPAGSFSAPTIVVEQPELHLHPAFQATLADLFCDTVTRSGPMRPRIVAETHSPALVNRLGALILEGKLPATSVQILLFEHDAEAGATQISTAFFDEEGILNNWPYGFFEPEV